MLRVPGKYKRCGIKVKCLKCKVQVGDVCGETGSPISTCEHIDKHKYNLVVCVPKTPGARRTKIVHANNFDDALAEMLVFKKELVENSYRRPTPMKPAQTNMLIDFMMSYLEIISGVNSLPHLNRKRSKEHVGDTERAFGRFLVSLENTGYNINTLDAQIISDNEVGIYHDFLKSSLSLGKRAYNKHMTIMKTLFNWIKHEQDYKVTNPFNRIEMTSDKKDIPIILRSEFDGLLAAITVENGFEPVSKKNLFRPWLCNAYRLAVETGLRREELLLLRWADIHKISDGKFACRVPNLKVNRILKGKGGGESTKYIPVTKSLLAFLVELGYGDLKDADITIIQYPGIQLKPAIDLLSRAFGHFIKCATDRKLEFGVLRKTYMTRLTIAAGPNAKLFTGSSSDEVLKNHYLSQAFMAANLEDFSVF